MVPKKSQSKRQTIKMKHKIEKKVTEHKRKLRRAARKNPMASSRKLSKDPGLPNLHPFKEQLIRKMKQVDEQVREGERIRQRRALEISKRRKAATQARSLQDMVHSATARQDAYNVEQERLQDIQQQQALGLFNGGNDSATKVAESTRRAFFKHLRKVVEKSDVILEVLDARDPIACRAPAIERFVLGAASTKQKRIIMVLNKIDLVPAEIVQEWVKYLRRFFPTIAFKASTQEQANHLSAAKGARVRRATRDGKVVTGAGAAGAETLLQLIKNYSRNAGSKSSVTVGLIGYPNVGKSSIINSLRRQRAAAVSNKPGQTTAMQEITIDKQVKILDCPGIIFDDNAEVDGGAGLLLRNCISVQQMSDPERAIEAILERCEPKKLMMLYEIPSFENVDEFLSHVAVARGKLGKGGVPDKNGAARQVLQDWNVGRVPFYTLPPDTNVVTEDEGSAAIVEEWSKEFDIDGLLSGMTNVKVVHDENAPDVSNDIDQNENEMKYMTMRSSGIVGTGQKTLASVFAEDYESDDDDMNATSNNMQLDDDENMTDGAISNNTHGTSMSGLSRHTEDSTGGTSGKTQLADSNALLRRRANKAARNQRPVQSMIDAEEEALNPRTETMQRKAQKQSTKKMRKSARRNANRTQDEEDMSPENDTVETTQPVTQSGQASSDAYDFSQFF